MESINNNSRTNIFLNSNEPEDVSEIGSNNQSSPSITNISNFISNLQETDSNVNFHQEHLFTGNKSSIIDLVNNSNDSAPTNGVPPNPVNIHPISMDPNDPYLIVQQKVTPSLINLHLKLGPLQPSPSEFHFPKTQRPTSDSLLCFNASWFERKLPDGSVQPRQWLSYSKVLNKAFCVFCMLFNPRSQPPSTPVTQTGGPGKVSEAWTKTGWDTWNNGSRDIRRHEESPLHRVAEMTRVRALSSSMAAGPLQCNNINTSMETPPEVLENRKLVRAVVDYLLLQTPQLMVQRDRSDTAESSVLIRHLQHIMDPGVQAAVHRMQTVPANHDELNLLSWKAQSRMAAAICESIEERLSMFVKKRRSFSLLLDPVIFDSRARTGWLVVWIRYLVGDNPTECDISQSLIDVLPLPQETTELHQQILDVLRRYNLESNNMTGYSIQINEAFNTDTLFQLVNFTANQTAWPLLLDTKNNDKNDSSVNALSHHGLLISVLLEKGVKLTKNLSRTLGLVKQLCEVWKVKEINGFMEKYMSQNSSMETFPSQGTVDREDGMLDFLMDWYDEITQSLEDLINHNNCTHPQDLFTLTSLVDGLQKPVTKETIQILRSAIGIMRPAFSCCHDDTIVIYIRQMLDRFKQETAANDANDDQNIERDPNVPPSPKQLKLSPTHEEHGVSLNYERRQFFTSLYTTLSVLFPEDHLQLMHEMTQFSRANLISSNSSLTRNTLNQPATICKLVKVDCRAAQREAVDFKPIFMENERTKEMMAISLWREMNNKQSAADDQSGENSQSHTSNSLNGDTNNANSKSSDLTTSPTDVPPPIPLENSHQNSSEHFLTPLRLLYQFSSFPNLLAIYKVISLFPALDRSDWMKQRARIRQYLLNQSTISTNQTNTAVSLDDFGRCGLFVAAIEDQTNQLWYLPTDAIIEKFAASSPNLKKSLSLLR